jgi:hypothetical protein
VIPEVTKYNMKRSEDGRGGQVEHHERSKEILLKTLYFHVKALWQLVVQDTELVWPNIALEHDGLQCLI